MDLSSISLNDFSETIRYLREADSQNSNKGKLTKEWYAQNLGATARASIVNELRQAGNRVREQLNSQDAQHVLYVVADPNALDKLINDCQKFLYNGLETILFMETAKGVSDSATPVFLLSNIVSNSPVGGFYLTNFKDLRVHRFSPDRKVISTGASQTNLPPAKL